jgi:hypothetical protein
LLRQRIEFEYDNKKAIVGVPFGCSIACVLANIYLTDLDREMNNFKVKYFRYADDIMILGKTEEEVTAASQHLDNHIKSLNLIIKPSKATNGCITNSKVKFLGLMFGDTDVMLPIEKQRKILRMVDASLLPLTSQLKKLSIDGGVALCVSRINELVSSRFRSVAIIDYYLKHITDENQLKTIDRLVAEKVISAVLGRKFKNGLFKTIPYKKLRDQGLISLVHRSRLHKHGYIKTKFMSLLNAFFATRQSEKLAKRADRINQLRIIRKLKKHGPKI